MGGWILLSIVVFMISAQTTPGVSASADHALSGGGSLLTGSTVLVLLVSILVNQFLAVRIENAPARNC